MRAAPARSVSFLCFLLVALLTITPAHGEIAFKAEGKILYEVFMNDQVERSSAKDFRVVVQGCRWLVESSNLDEDFYMLKTFADGLINNVARGRITNNPALNKYASVVEKEDVPNDDISGISFIWLAYCSACYLDSVRDNAFKPVWLLDDYTLRPKGYTMHGLLKRENGFLPQELVYLHDGLIRARARGSPVTMRAPAPFQNGFTNAIYRMLATRTVGSIKIPQRFEFLRFGLRKDGIATSLGLRCRITGELTTAYPRVAESDFLRELEGRVVVADTRFRKADVPVPQVNYSTTNFQFLKSDDPRLLREREIAIGNQAVIARWQHSMEKSRWIILGVIGIVVVPPLWFFCSKLWKPKR